MSETRHSGTRPLGRRTLLKAGAAGILATMLPAARPAHAAVPPPPEAPAVDLALILLVDASASIGKGLLDFQLRGHAEAFRSEAVAAAISSGRHGRIAVQLAQFAGPGTLTQLVGWTLLSGAEDCTRLADAIDQAPGVSLGGSTALGNAIVDAVQNLERVSFIADKRKIDIVSNGFSNAGIGLASARGFAAEAGVTVNALAILDEYPWLGAYFEEEVIVGDGAFARTAATRADFAAAFLAKLVTEIV